MKERIIKKLQNAISIRSLVVTNKSHLHNEHIETNNSGETHFDIEISSSDLDNLGLLDSHKKVKNLIKDEFERNGLHSLTIKVLRS